MACLILVRMPCSEVEDCEEDEEDCGEEEEEEEDWGEEEVEEEVDV